MWHQYESAAIITAHVKLRHYLLYPRANDGRCTDAPVNAKRKEEHYQEDAVGGEELVVAEGVKRRDGVGLGIGEPLEGAKEGEEKGAEEEQCPPLAGGLQLGDDVR